MRTWMLPQIMAGHQYLLLQEMVVMVDLRISSFNILSFDTVFIYFLHAGHNNAFKFLRDVAHVNIEVTNRTIDFRFI